MTENVQTNIPSFDEIKITQATAGGEGGTFPTVPTGSYSAFLKSIEPDVQRKFESDEMQEVLHFIYVIDTENGQVWVHRNCRPMIGPKTNLEKDLIALVPAEYFKAKDDSTKLKALLKKLVGKQYQLTVELKTSAKGRKYNKFIAVGPAAPIALDGPTDSEFDF